MTTCFYIGLDLNNKFILMTLQILLFFPTTWEHILPLSSLYCIVGCNLRQIKMLHGHIGFDVVVIAFYGVKK
jgi:hypothetical protein